MSEAPSVAPVLETGPWLERRDVIGPADVVSEVPADIFQKSVHVPYRFTPSPSWSQLYQLAAPLGEALAVVASIHGALFTDAGHAWTQTFRGGAIKTSAGAQVSADVLAGYFAPFTTTVGAAWGHDGSGVAAGGVTAYFRVGKAF